MTIYRVRYSNYEPAEVESQWAKLEDAERHCEELNDQDELGSQMWTVDAVEIG